ncbi:hypothetical protein [Campylobacter devanensis]|uniref:hypothetical protein n=1 Tax=Campylobacter devanensis TaxID=3161138 RepID=UPI000A34E0C9|nr:MULTISPECIES: hypothetical protein [unclassified Campylobacter]
MQILSHRGWLELEGQKNQVVAFKKEFEFCSNQSLDNRFSQYRGGVETDIRDYNDSLVISHNITTQNSLSLEQFFEIYNSFNINYKATLALNIKANGLQEIKSKISQYNIQNYFFFDMSAPDALAYIKYGLNVFTRQSEYKFN